MIRASQIALAACLALLSLLCGGRNRAVASNAATTAVQAFLAAYNRHDVQGVLDTLDIHDFLRYSDCDWALRRPVSLPGPRVDGSDEIRFINRFAHRLRVQFAEGARFADLGDSVVHGSGVDLSVRLSSDVLAAQNLDPLPDTMQFLLQPPDDTRIIAWSTSAAAECAGRGTPALLFPAQPTREHTAALIHAYFDAYNDRDGPRVLQLLSPAATLDDCGAHGPAGFQGKARIAAHLRYRFENDDHLTLNSITFGDPTSARVAAVQVTRSSHWVEPIGLGLKMATTSDGRRLQSVVILTC